MCLDIKEEHPDFQRDVQMDFTVIAKLGIVLSLRCDKRCLIAWTVKKDWLSRSKIGGELVPVTVRLRQRLNKEENGLLQLVLGGLDGL